MSKLDLLLERVVAAGVDLRETGPDRWRGDCVACGGTDRMTAGLDINENVFVRCWGATCEPQHILNVLNLTWGELRDDQEAAPAGPLTVRSSAVQSRSIRWVWEGRLAAGYLTVQTGLEGLGKSVFAAWMAAQLTRGTLPGDWHGQPADVLIVAGEDGREDTWKPRLDLAGHDPERVSFLALEKLGADWNVRDGIEQLRTAIGESSATVVIFDSLLDHFPPSRSGETANQPTFVREALFPLKLLVRELDLAGVMSLHPSKGRAANFRDLVQMSQAFTAIPRIGLLFTCHPDDDDGSRDYRRVMLRGKGNIGRNPGALEFRIVGRDYTHDDGRTTEREVVTNVHRSAVTMADLRAKAAEHKPSKIEQAMDAIRLVLSGGEWLPAAGIRERLETENNNHNDTINEATKRLGVEKQQRRGGWHWRLPPADADPQSDGSGHSRDFDNSDPATLTPPARARSIQTPTLTPKNGRIPSNDGQSRRVGILEQEALFEGSESDGETYRDASDSDPPPSACVVYLDTETTGLDPRADQLVLAGFAADDAEPVTLRHPNHAEQIQAWLELDATYCGHNIGFDMHFLECAGYAIPDPGRWSDTVLVAHVVGERRPGQTALRRLTKKLIDAGELPADTLEPEHALNTWLRAARRSARKAGARRPEKGDAPPRLLEPYLQADVLTHARCGAPLRRRRQRPGAGARPGAPLPAGDLRRRAPRRTARPRRRPRAAGPHRGQRRRPPRAAVRASRPAVQSERRLPDREGVVRARCRPQRCAADAAGEPADVHRRHARRGR